MSSQSPNENRSFVRPWLTRFRRNGRVWWDSFREQWGRRQSLGWRGERAAARMLKKKGLRIVTTGYRDRIGEIDIVALDGETVVFVEVKTRRHHGAGHPLEAVDERKQAQLVRLAHVFVRRHGLMEYRCRFDVIGVTWSDTDGPEIRHIPAAFQARGVGVS